MYGKYYSEPNQNVPTHNTALVKIAKGRNVGLGGFIVSFIPQITLFKDYDENYQQANYQLEEETPF